MKEDKKYTKLKVINPILKFDMMTTKMEAMIFHGSRDYAKFSHSSVSSIYLANCQKGNQSAN